MLKSQAKTPAFLSRASFGQGFSLVEVMMGLGILSLGSMAMMKLFEGQISTQRKIGQSSELTQLDQELTSFLSKPENCGASFLGIDPLMPAGQNIVNLSQGAPALPAPTPSPSIVPTAFYPTLGQSGAVRRGGVSIKSYVLSSTTDPKQPDGIWIDVANKSGNVNLTISYQKENNGKAELPVVRTHKLWVSLDNGGKITACRLFGEKMNNHVLNDLTVDGVTYLGADSNGLDPNKCGKGNGTGGIAYSAKDRTLYQCDGLGWAPVSQAFTSPYLGTRNTAKDFTYCKDPQGDGTIPCDDSGQYEKVIQESFSCPPGYGAVQMKGKLGWAVGYLEFYCRHPVTKDIQLMGGMGTPYGGSDFTGTTCPDGTYITQVAFRAPMSEMRGCGYSLTTLKYWCTPVQDPLSIPPATPPPAITTYRAPNGTGFFGAEVWQTFKCPNGTAVVEAKMQPHRSMDWKNPDGTRHNCDCRSCEVVAGKNVNCKACMANLQVVCGPLNPNTSTAEPQ